MCSNMCVTYMVHPLNVTQCGCHTATICIQQLEPFLKQPNIHRSNHTVRIDINQPW